MTVYKGVNLTQAESAVKQYEAGDVSGRMRVLRDKVTFGTTTVAIGDTFLGPKIPKNCRVVDAYVAFDGDLGTSGIFDLGYLASASGDIAADVDAFVKNADGDAGAIIKRAGSTADEACAGIGKYFDEAVQTQVICTEATTTTEANGKVMEWVVFYIID